jgi:hypothetical protein
MHTLACTHWHTHTRTHIELLYNKVHTIVEIDGPCKNVHTFLYERMTNRLAMSVEKPGARHPDAIKPSFISDKQIT